MESLQDFIQQATQKIYGQLPEEAKDKQICISCKAEASSFRDELSRQEYALSKLCQACQDRTFSSDE